MRAPRRLGHACLLAALCLLAVLVWPRRQPPPAASVGCLPRTAAAVAAPGSRAARPAPPPLPARYRGQVIRKRVRYFPHKLLALTFDDGPDPGTTPLALKALAQYRAHANFFVLGGCARAHPDLVKQEVAAGHAVESHSYRHPATTSAARAVEELSLTADTIAALTGHRPTLFRPPYGITTGNLCQAARRQGYGVVLWTISSADSSPIPARTIARNVIHTPNPGDIVLMHDGAGHRATMAALPQVLRELSAAGFQFVTVPELLSRWARWQDDQKAAKAGKEP